MTICYDLLLDIVASVEMAPPLLSDSEAEVEQWLLIETEKDFCVVKREAVRCSASADVDVGDRVSFYWSATMELTGVVRCISGK